MENLRTNVSYFQISASIKVYLVNNNGVDKVVISGIDTTNSKHELMLLQEKIKEYISQNEK